MTAVTDQTQYLGFNEMDTGYAGKQFIKSSISPFNTLDNVIWAKRIMDGTSKTVRVLAELWCPSVTIAAGAAAVTGTGYANFAIGTRIICSNGAAVKSGDVGVDTWLALVGA